MTAMDRALMAMAALSWTVMLAIAVMGAYGWDFDE